MFKHLFIHKIVWSLIFFLIFIAALGGVLYPRMYDGLIAPEFIPGALPQDIFSLILCVCAFYIIYTLRPEYYRTQIFLIGLIGSFFYLYGIFTIERVYTTFYLVYLAIFALTSWSLVYALMDFNYGVFATTSMPKRVSWLSSGLGAGIGGLFTFLWTMALIPLMYQHNRIDYLYSIYILDLCFVMPAFFITSFLTLRKQVMGLLFLPAVYVIGFFVIFPLGLGELAKFIYGQSYSLGSMVVSFGFSVLMLCVSYVHMRYLHITSS